MTSKQTKWNWSKECQKKFDTIEKLTSRETLLSYPNFNEPFEIHTDASKLQLGSVISQKGKPIIFYCRKINPTQINYTSIKHELLSITETRNKFRNKLFGQFRNKLFGQQIEVYTDHKN